MKRIVTSVLALSLLTVFSLGCGEDKATTKTETTVSTPGGTTTVTTEEEIKTTGDNPPPVSP